MSDFCKIAILTPNIIPPPLVNVWLIFDLQKYVNWLCVFLEVNPCFQKAHVFCMDLQPAADPYNVVCKSSLLFSNYALLCYHKYILNGRLLYSLPPPSFCPTCQLFWWWWFDYDGYGIVPILHVTQSHTGLHYVNPIHVFHISQPWTSS